MTDLERAIKHIKTRADAWAVKEVEKALSQEPTKREIEREYLFQSLREDFEELQAENDDLRDQLAMRSRFQKQEPCEDAISDIMGISKSRTHDIMENELRCVQTASCGGCDRECGECSLLMDDKEIIKAYGYVIRMLELPSVTQKSGKWIAYEVQLPDRTILNYRCSVCGRKLIGYSTETLSEAPFCHCGARMESEDK